MDSITARDRQILRERARHHMDLAHCAENDAILAKWHCIAAGKRGTPTVRFLVSNFTNETITPRLLCEGESARRLEAQMLAVTASRDLFGDDTPVPAALLIPRSMWALPFGNQPRRIRAEGENAKGYHIEPIITDLSEDFHKILPGSFGVNVRASADMIAFAEDIFGDILPVRECMGSLPGAITNPLVHLMGMENYYLAMYDAPELLHRVMDDACSLFERYYDYLQAQGLLLPTADFSPVAQESFAFNHELPADRACSVGDCWGFLESQETTAVSPETFAEFVFPYQDRLARRFGLLSYGCCERVDAIFPYISRWKNLRKLSVSPFNDERLVGEYLRGTSIVYYSKPRAEFITNPGPLDEEAIIGCFRGIAEAASGCILEIAQREAGTIYRDYARGRRYVELARQTVEKYWKP